MMDPKMDAGMLCNRANSVPVSWEDAVEREDVNVLGLAGGLEPRDIIIMLDQTLSCLVTWLEGHSLAQTVMTNLYLHHPDRLQCVVLKAVSVAFLKISDVIKDIISKAGVFEEEDFQPHTYGFRLGQDVTEQRCLAGLREAEELLGKDIRRTKAKEGQERSEAEEADHLDFLSLQARLKFLRLFFSCLTVIQRGEPGEAVRLIAQCEDLVAGLTSGVPTHQGRVRGFEPLTNQRLLPPTFPRYAEIVSRSEALQYIASLVSRLSSVTAVINITSFNLSLEFFHSFSCSSPCVLSRSVLQLLYTPLHSSLTARPGISQAAGPPIPPSFADILRDSCKNFMAPPCLMPAPRILPGQPPSPLHTLQVKLCLETFFSQCCRPFGLLIQTTGHNRARQRDKICLVLEEFCSLQEEADRLDNMLNSLGAAVGRQHNLYIGTWLLYHVLKLMIRYILSGFELELYSVHEWSMMWWYLFELLYPWLINCLHRADTLLSEHLETVDREKKLAKNKKKSKPGSKKAAKSRPYLTEIAAFQAHANMCAGYYKLMVAARQENKILSPSPQFDNEQVRYEHRFGTFATLLTPPLMPYTQYKEVLEHTEKAPANSLYTAASRDFGQARQILESVQPSTPEEDFSNLITINKTNFVAASVLARDKSRPIDFDFSLHLNFPTVKLG